MTSPAPDYYSGCQGDFYFNSNELYVTKWSFNDVQNTQDLKNKNSGGFAYPLGCDRTGTINFEFWFNNAVHGSPGGIPVVVGYSGAFVLHSDNSTGPTISGTSCLCTELDYDHDMAPNFLKVTGKAVTQGNYVIFGQ